MKVNPMRIKCMKALTSQWNVYTEGEYVVMAPINPRQRKREFDTAYGYAHRIEGDYHVIERPSLTAPVTRCHFCGEYPCDCDHPISPAVVDSEMPQERITQ